MTIAAARAELVAAFDAAGLSAGAAGGRVEPPCVLVYSNGVDADGIAHIVRGQVPWAFRAVVVAGIFDEGAVPGDELATALGTAVGVVRDLAAWRVVSVGRDTVLRVAGGLYLGAELVASRMIDV